jgi:hypothetical protein
MFSNLEVPVAQRKESSWSWMFPVILVLALGLVAWGIYILVRNPASQLMLSAGMVSAFVVLAVWLAAASVRASLRTQAQQLDAQAAAIRQQLEQATSLLSQIGQQQLISERAKALAFRGNEREALRKAIREETARKDWEAALTLTSQFETIFGYKQEADTIRQEIESQREGEVRRHVDEAIAAIDKHCRCEEWTLALREAERLMRLYPNDFQAQRLAQDVETRRQNFKRELLARFDEAVTQHDTDSGIEAIKQLDAYLTPAEAQALQDRARQVFKDRLMLLRQQLTAAITGHSYKEAVRIGEVIMDEFPNSRMAAEVSEKIGLLRQRAVEGEPVKV